VNFREQIPNIRANDVILKVYSTAFRQAFDAGCVRDRKSSLRSFPSLTNGVSTGAEKECGILADGGEDRREGGGGEEVVLRSNGRRDSAWRIRRNFSRVKFQPGAKSTLTYEEQYSPPLKTERILTTTSTCYFGKTAVLLATWEVRLRNA